MEKNKKEKIKNAALWVLFSYAMSQLIRLSGNIYVSRLVDPETFGLIAAAYVVITGINMFTDVGIWPYVVRHGTGQNQNIYNPVWTVQVIRGAGISLLILLICLCLSLTESEVRSNVLGVFGGDDFLIVLMVLSPIPFISGFVSLANPIYSRSFDRRKIELIGLASQLIGTLSMIGVAFVYPSVWALVTAVFVSSFAVLFMSHKLFSLQHKLHLDFNVVKDLFKFGKWIILASLGAFISTQADRIFIGQSLDLAQLGLYSIAAMMFAAIVSLVGAIITKIIFPLFSAVKDNQPSLLNAYNKLRLVSSIGVGLLAAILYWFSPLIIAFLYDDRYLVVGELLSILSIGLILFVTIELALELLTAIGVTKTRSKYVWAKCLALFVLFPVILSEYGLVGLVWVVALLPLAGLPFVFFDLKKNNYLNIGKELLYIFICLVPLILIATLENLTVVVQ